MFKVKKPSNGTGAGRAFTLKGGKRIGKDVVNPVLQAIEDLDEQVIAPTGFQERAEAERQRFEDSTDAEYTLVPVMAVETADGNDEVPLYPALVFQSRALKEEFLAKMKERFPGEILGDKYISGDVLARALGFTLTAHRPVHPKVKPVDKKLLALRTQR